MLIISGSSDLVISNGALTLNISGAKPNGNITFDSSDITIGGVTSTLTANSDGSGSFDVTPNAVGEILITATDDNARPQVATFTVNILNSSSGVSISGPGSAEVGEQVLLRIKASADTLLNVSSSSGSVTVAADITTDASGNVDLVTNAISAGESAITVTNPNNQTETSTFTININEEIMDYTIKLTTPTLVENIGYWGSGWEKFPMRIQASVVDDIGLNAKDVVVTFSSNDLTVSFDATPASATTDRNGQALIGAMANKNNTETVDFTASIDGYSSETNTLTVFYRKPTLGAPIYPVTNGTDIIDESLVSIAYARIPLIDLKADDVVRFYWGKQLLEHTVVENDEHVDFPLPLSYLSAGLHFSAYSVTDFTQNTVFSDIKQIMVFRDSSAGAIVDQPEPIITQTPNGYINQTSMLNGVVIQIPQGTANDADLDGATSVTIYWKGYNDDVNQLNWNQELTITAAADGTFLDPLEMPLDRTVLIALGEGNGVASYVVNRGDEPVHASNSAHALVRVNNPG